MLDHLEVHATALGNALGIHPSQLPLCVLRRQIPAPHRRSKVGWRWLLIDIRESDPALADRLIPDALPPEVHFRPSARRTQKTAA